MFSYHPDEFHSLRGVLSLAAGDLNPHFFNYGCCYLDLVDISASILSGGLVSNLTVQRLPEALRAWTIDARIVSLLAGLGAVVVVAYAAEALAAGAGLWAGLALALMPLHALQARYATVDGTLCFFTALTLLFAILAAVRKHPRLYLAAGAAAGLAASTKYSGAVVLVVPVLAALLDRDLPLGRRLGLGAGSVAAAFLAFAVTSPYVFLAWDEARQSIGFELQHMRVGESPAIEADPSGLFFHLKWITLGTVALATAGLIACVVYAFRRFKEAPSWVPLAVLSVLGFAMIAAAKVRFARYEVFLLPMGAIGVGALIASTSRRGWRWAAAVWLLLAAAVCLHMDLRLMAPDSRDLALAAILQRTAPSDRVGMIWQPWFQSPPLDYCNGGAALRSSSLWSRFQKPLRPLVITGYDPARLKTKRPRWFVASCVEMRDYIRAGMAHPFWHQLEASYHRVGQWGAGLTDGLMPRGLDPPQDWAYPCMRLYLFERRH